MKQQHYDTLQYLQSFVSSKGYTPSMRDVADHFQGISTNAVEKRYRVLEENGYIARIPKIARSLRILKRMPKQSA